MYEMYLKVYFQTYMYPTFRIVLYSYIMFWAFKHFIIKSVSFLNGNYFSRLLQEQ